MKSSFPFSLAFSLPFSLLSRTPSVILTLSLLLLLFPMSGLTLPAAQEQEVEQVQEFVEVVNVEVIVRVLKKGKPVCGLKESDFIILENDKPQTVTSFMEVKRKIGVDAPPPPIQKETTIRELEKPGIRRVFLLYFRLAEPSPQYHDALDYFFKNIYRDGDYALLIVKNNFLKVTRQHQVTEILRQFKDTLDLTARQAKLERDALIKDLDTLFRRFEEEFKRNEKKGDPQEPLIEYLLSQYRTAWDSYRFKHTSVDIDKLKALAASFKEVELEKWGIVFYQHETFPKFNPESISPELEDSFKHVLNLRKGFTYFDREMQQSTGSLDIFKDIQQAFIDANTTFHLLLSSAGSSGKIESVYLQTGEIQSNWQDAFLNISKATGGEIIDGKILDKSLEQAVNKEDIYYRLTYEPESYDNTTREIEIQLDKKGLDLFYLRRLILIKSQEIGISEFSFLVSTLKFVLNRYRMFFDGTRMSGDIEVKVTAVDDNGEMSTFTTDLTPESGKTLVSMKLDFPVGGNYTLVVEALDRQTGKSAVYSQGINIPKTLTPKDLEGILVSNIHKQDPGFEDSKSKLNAILAKASDYCEKLKKTTFYFTCREEIIDRLTVKGKTERDMLFNYDYQIIMHENGKMDERRELIGDNSPTTKTKKKKVIEKEKAENEARSLLITNFFSRYSFLMPTTLLSVKNREKYDYQLLSEEKIEDRVTYKIAVEPKRKGIGVVNHGIVWIDGEDGSVARIELNPRSLRGIDRLQARAGRKGTRLKLTDTHRYEVRKEGIRFPSQTEISRMFLSGQPDEPRESGESGKTEHALTVFTYKDYRFFQVNVDVVESGHN